jgi:hypothetical protein
VNNNKPGEFVSSSGNFFDLASYFFGRGYEPGGIFRPKEVAQTNMVRCGQSNAILARDLTYL